MLLQLHLMNRVQFMYLQLFNRWVCQPNLSFFHFNQKITSYKCCTLESIHPKSFCSCYWVEVKSCLRWLWALKLWYKAASVASFASMKKTSMLRWGLLHFCMPNIILNVPKIPPQSSQTNNCKTIKRRCRYHTVKELHTCCSLAFSNTSIESVQVLEDSIFPTKPA